MATKTVRPTASTERNTASGYATSWASYSHDSDCQAYDGGYTTRIGGINTAKNFNAWYQFPTGASFLDPAKYVITAASFQIFQPYFGSPNGYSGSGTIRARIGRMTNSGTNALSSTAQSATVAAKTTDGTWYTFSNVLTGARALQSETANGVYMDVSDWSSSKWYARLSYHGGSSYYPRFNLTYSNRQYALSVPSVTGATVSGAGTYTWGTSVTVKCTSKTGYSFVKWVLSGGSSATSTNPSYTFTMPTAATTATAVVQANTYTIRYNANGGSNAPSAHSYTYAPSGVTYLSSTVPNRSGYRFLGWSLSSTATSASYSAGQAWNLSNASNYTLYAVWEKAIYTVSAVTSNATVTGTGDKEFGSSVTIKCIPHPGRKFRSFVLEGGISATVTDNPYTFTMPAGDVTIRVIVELRDLVRVPIDGTWKAHLVYVNQNGTWTLAEPNASVGGEWKNCN